MAILYLAYTLEAFGIIIHAIKYVTSSGIIPVDRHKKTVISLTTVGSMSLQLRSELALSLSNGAGSSLADTAAYTENLAVLLGQVQFFHFSAPNLL
jgi:hypothetical protein